MKKITPKTCNVFRSLAKNFIFQVWKKKLGALSTSFATGTWF